MHAMALGSDRDVTESEKLFYDEDTPLCLPCACISTKVNLCNSVTDLTTDSKPANHVPAITKHVTGYAVLLYL
jgi:hypothetical protein